MEHSATELAEPRAVLCVHMHIYLFIYLSISLFIYIHVYSVYIYIFFIIYIMKVWCATVHCNLLIVGLGSFRRALHLNYYIFNYNNKYYIYINWCWAPFARDNPISRRGSQAIEFTGPNGIGFVGRLRLSSLSFALIFFKRVLYIYVYIEMLLLCLLASHKHIYVYKYSVFLIDVYIYIYACKCNQTHSSGFKCTQCFKYAQMQSNAFKCT